MNTRRYPRTLTEAFGPYAGGGPLHPMPDPHARPAHEWALFAAAAVAVIVLAFVL